MKRVLRWGRSAYETDADLAVEAARLRSMGVDSVHSTSLEPPLELLEGADCLVVTSGVRVDAQVLDALWGSYVLTTTSGYDHIDLVEARLRAVHVARLAGVRRDAVVETALGAAIQLLRRHPAQYAYASRGVWARPELPKLAPMALSAATVGVVGLGVIGSRFAECVGALGAEVLGVDPEQGPDGIARVELGEALERADVLSLHCSLNEGNRGMIGPVELRRMKPGAVLINTARGGLLDIEAAVEQVRTGALRGLAVDVFPQEPFPALAEVAAVAGVLVTPHAAGYTHDLGARVALGVIAAVQAWGAGEAPEYLL